MRGVRRAAVESAQAHPWHVHCLILAKETPIAAVNPSIMTAFVPDLSPYWLPAPTVATNTADVALRDDDPVAATLLRELEALVERVNAARCIF